MSFAARAGILTGVVTVALLGTTVGCDSVFRFDEPATSTDGSAGDAAPDADADRQVRCIDDNSCGGLRCQVATGTCVACVADTNCSGPLRRCDSALGVCVECNAPTDCPERQGCDTVTKRCLDLCVDSDDPCPGSGFVCDGDRKLCIECKKSENCAGSTTGPVCDVPIGRCVECTGNAQCPSARPVCDRRSGRCVACVTSAECGVGSVCDPTALICRQLP